MLSTMWADMVPSLVIISKIMWGAIARSVRKITMVTASVIRSRKVAMEVGNVGRMIYGKLNMISDLMM